MRQAAFVSLDQRSPKCFVTIEAEKMKITPPFVFGLSTMKKGGKLPSEMSLFPAIDTGTHQDWVALGMANAMPKWEFPPALYAQKLTVLPLATAFCRFKPVMCQSI